MLLCDLKLIDDDLAVSDDDAVLISDVDLLVQDIYNQVRCFYYTWALDFRYGSWVSQYVNMPDDPIHLVEIKNDLIAIFKRDARIVRDSWQVKIETDMIEVQFLPVGRDEPVTLIMEAK